MSWSAPKSEFSGDAEPATVTPTRSPRAARGLLEWRAAAAKPGETLRWESVDGERWVSISVGHGPNAGRAVVADDRGRYEAVDSSDEALALAERWRR